MLGAGVTALLIGVPTGIIITPFYHRMTPVQWWNYPVWAVTVLLSGLTLATYIRTGAAPGLRQHAAGFAGGALTLFAVGCPVCNKMVVAIVGVTGALIEAHHGGALGDHLRHGVVFRGLWRGHGFPGWSGGSRGRRPRVHDRP